MDDSSVIERFCENLSTDHAEMVKSVSSKVMGVSSRITVAVKWQKLTFALDGDYHHWICAVYAGKKGVSLLFHFGGLLDDTHQVMIAGTSRFMRKLEYRSPAEIDGGIIGDYVMQALEQLPYFKENWRALYKQEAES